MGRSAAANHHCRISFLSHPCHAGRHELKALAIGCANFREKIDIAPEFDTAVQVACKHRESLVLAHRPRVEIDSLVRFESLSILRFHQRHTKLVQVEPLSRLFGDKDGGSGYVL